MMPGASRVHSLGVTVVLFAVCFGFRTELESDPVLHVIVQLPMLGWAGWLLADALSDRWGRSLFETYNTGGWAGLLVALVAIAFWMLPRSIDGALSSGEMELAKFISVPLLIGAPLRLSWRRAHPLLRGVLMANALSMLGVLAWLYTAAPVRICNSYLVGDQQRLGEAFIYVGVALAVVWCGRLFMGPSDPTAARSEIDLLGNKIS